MDYNLLSKVGENEPWALFQSSNLFLFAMMPGNFNDDDAATLAFKRKRKLIHRQSSPSPLEKCLISPVTRYALNPVKYAETDSLYNDLLCEFIKPRARNGGLH